MPNTSAARDLDNEPLNGQQLNSVETIVSIVARRKGENPEVIQKILAERYGIDHYAKIPQRDYRDAMEFLIDLNMDEIGSGK